MRTLLLKRFLILSSFLIETIPLMIIQSLERVEGTPRKLRRFKIWPESS